VKERDEECVTGRDRSRVLFKGERGRHIVLVGREKDKEGREKDKEGREKDKEGREKDKEGGERERE